MKAYLTVILSLLINNSYSQDSIILSKSDNNIVFTNIYNLIKLSSYQTKNIKIEAVNCEAFFDSIDQNVIFLKPISKDFCTLNLKDSITNKNIAHFNYNVKKIPPLIASLNGVATLGKIKEEDLCNLEINFLNKSFEIRFNYKINSVEVGVKGRVYHCSGSNLCGNAIEFIKKHLEKGESFYVQYQYTDGLNIHYGEGRWTKDF